MSDNANTNDIDQGNDNDQTMMIPLPRALFRNRESGDRQLPAVPVNQLPAAPVDAVPVDNIEPLTFEPAKPEDFYVGGSLEEEFPGEEYDDKDFDLPPAALKTSYAEENGDLCADTEVNAEVNATVGGYFEKNEPIWQALNGETNGSTEITEEQITEELTENEDSPEHFALDNLDNAGTAEDGTSEEDAEEDAALPDVTEFKDRFADRELSWLSFNERVFEQAQDEDLPLLERAWFLTIFCSNLDEFYMVRVAGLKRRIAAGIATVAASGLTPRQLDTAIAQRAHELTRQVSDYYSDKIEPSLAREGINVTHWDMLPDGAHTAAHGYFRRQIFPVLSPLAVDPSHPFPYISGLSLNLAVIVRNPRSGKEHFARVKVPALLPRLIPISENGLIEDPAEQIARGIPVDFVPIEEIITAHLDHLFPGMEIIEAHTFRVTRNENLEVEEDDAENILTAMETELLKRRFGPAVRLEVTEGMPPHVLDFLIRNLEISQNDVFRLPAPLDLRALNVLHDLDLPALKFPAYVPVTARGLLEVESANPIDIFSAIRAHDVLLHHPYDSFSTSIQQFIVQAAADPKVLAIKQTLYRTSGDSPIVQALIDAAEAGKQVVAIVEIKARFDEEANISWARKMERVGIHVVYGMVGLKTHCKLCLVVRQESDGLRRYCHVGTGNYHPKTARGYEDLGLLTVDPEVAQDLTRLFNQLSGYAPRSSFHRLLVAPRSIRDGLIERIEAEVQNHKEGKPAWVRFKFNSIVDERISDALYRASQQGVPVDIQVRGICSLKPGIPGLSQNMRVHSILGRYLEHSRIYAFCNNDDPEVWIGSADLMHRNLDRRVEALVRITDPQQVEHLVELVTKGVADTTSSWRLHPDQVWRRVAFAPDGTRLEDIQNTLMARASDRVSRRDTTV